jgi:hypothetical protein
MTEVMTDSEVHSWASPYRVNYQWDGQWDGKGCAWGSRRWHQDGRITNKRNRQIGTWFLTLDSRYAPKVIKPRRLTDPVYLWRLLLRIEAHQQHLNTLYDEALDALKRLMPQGGSCYISREPKDAEYVDQIGLQKDGETWFSIRKLREIGGPLQQLASVLWDKEGRELLRMHYWREKWWCKHSWVKALLVETIIKKLPSGEVCAYKQRYVPRLAEVRIDQGTLYFGHQISGQRNTDHFGWTLLYISNGVESVALKVNLTPGADNERESSRE